MFPCSQILQGTFFNFVAMATAQTSTNCFDLQNVSQRCIFKVRQFQLDTLSCFGMMEEKQEGGVFYPPPGKIGLRLIKALDNRFYVKFMQL